jgi:hypothetical protein
MSADLILLYVIVHHRKQLIDPPFRRRAITALPMLDRALGHSNAPCHLTRTTITKDQETPDVAIMVGVPHPSLHA